MNNSGILRMDQTELIKERQRQSQENRTSRNGSISQHRIDVHNRMNEMAFERELKDIENEFT